MTMFLSQAEAQLTEDYLRDGYVIRPAADKEALDWIRAQFLILIINWF